MKFSLFFLFMLLAACVERDGIRPAFVIEDAHSSGSRVAVDGVRPLGASAGLAGSIAVWDLETGRKLAAWRGHQGTVNGLFLSGGRNLLVSGGWDGALAVWTLGGKLRRRVQTGVPVTAMAASPDLAVVWSGHDDGSLRRWSPALERLEKRRLPGGKRVTALALAGERLAVADQGGRLWLYDGDRAAPRLLARLPAYLRTLVFRPDGRQLFGGSWFRLYRWNLESGEMARLATAHRGIIAALDWSPARGELVSISRQTDSSVLALDPATGATRADFGRHDLCGAAVAVSRDGRYLMTTSDDASVRIWRLEAHKKGLPKEAR